MKSKYFILFFLTVIIVAITTHFCISFANENTDKKIKKESYSGIITDVFRQTWNHDMWTFTVKIDSVEMKECAEWYPYSWEYASVGDSIIKPPDTLIIIIKKPNGESKDFFYR